MEYFFFALIIVLIFYIKNTIDNKFESISNQLMEIHKAILQKKSDAEPVAPPKVETAREWDIPKTSFLVEDEKPAIPVFQERPAQPQRVPEKDYAAFQGEVKAEPQTVKQSWWDNFKEKNPDLEKFIGENLINKIGVLILVLGISYLVKFAIDKDWINEPARVGIGILAGALVMGIAHKLRIKYAAFSSVLVAGAIAIFYFTIGIAFHDYHLFSQTVAFIIMVFITAFSCLISLSYNRKELAVLSLIGGFAVPFMVSTGEGNYVVLFIYIIILNIGILALAYHRKWNIINILSYIFTIVLYGAWLFDALDKTNPPYAGALVFAFAFYFIFILINIINNLRTKGAFNAVELTILGSNTFLFYAAGMLILTDYHPELKGLFTTILALLNLIYAWFLYKKFGLDKSAVYLLIGLTLTFVTLAIPIQFERNYITLFWAAEAVLLIWLAQKSDVITYKFGSVIVHGLMLISLIMDWKKNYSADYDYMIIINPIFITGIVAIASLFAVARLLKNESGVSEKFGLIFNPETYRKYIFRAALIISFFVGILEVAYQANTYVSQPSAILFPALFHLIYCAVLCHFLWKSDSGEFKISASVLAIINIVLFSFWFSTIPYQEHTIYMETGIFARTAFLIHYALLIVILYFCYKLYMEAKQNLTIGSKGNSALIWVAAFFVIYIISSEMMLHALVFSTSPSTPPDLSSAFSAIDSVRNQVIKTGFPILWGSLAFIFLIIGIKKQNKPIRIIALTLLGLTILKLFLYDIRNASETGKIIAFILLGVLILIISFVYQKIKVLVLDDNKNTHPDETI